MNILNIEEEKLIIDNDNYIVNLSKDNILIEGYNKNKIVLNDYVSKIDITLHDGCELDLYIKNTKNFIDSVITINSYNQTKFNLYTSYENKDKCSLKIINNILGSKNENNLVIRNISYQDNSLIDVSLNVLKDTKDNVLVEDIKGICEGGKIITRPIMLIDTNEVIANHFVTISSIDKDMLFYLKSKGISTSSARKLILSGFLNGIMMGVNNE